MNWLLGRTVSFIPVFKHDKNGGGIKEDAIPVVGVVTHINNDHEWFCVSFKVGKTMQRECFKFYDLERTVMLCGRN